MKGFEPSLLEKLFDDSPRQSAQGVLKRLSLDDFKDSVARDIEALLNNRYSVDEDILKQYPQCQRSLATYGVRDFSGRTLASSIDRDFICQSLELAISRHETRLVKVKVHLDSSQRSTGALRFSISALLVIHPAREPVNFDALLQPTTLQYAVNKTSRPVAA
jgi:type VI secretion system protein ImpF